MKKITFTVLIFLAAGSVNAFAAETFSLSSADIQNHRLTEQQVFAGFGCHGGNTSPQLGWHNPPAGTKSFAITVYDPSAPTGSGWWHWTVVNIPVKTQTLPTGAGDEKSPTLPDGAVQGRNDYGYAGFGARVLPSAINRIRINSPYGR
jgi:Raf kinase inhibitor-like YbhB/YbcL family protein